MKSQPMYLPTRAIAKTARKNTKITVQRTLLLSMFGVVDLISSANRNIQKVDATKTHKNRNNTTPAVEEKPTLLRDEPTTAINPIEM